MSILLDGKQVANKVQSELAKEVKLLKQKNIFPQMVVIRVGDDPASIIYIKHKKIACKNIGVKFQDVILPENTSEEKLIEIIKKYNNDKSVNGILVQFPIPKHISKDVVRNTIAPNKDIDGLSDENNIKLFSRKQGLAPCTPLGIMRLLKEYGISIKDKKAVVIGRSIIVGAPLAEMLKQAGAKVEVCHSQTKDVPSITIKADILISAAGVPNLVTANMVKPGATVIDVGVTRKDKKIVGDIDFENVKEIAEYITPNPGGVGPMTIAMLLHNLVQASKINNQ